MVRQTKQIYLPKTKMKQTTYKCPHCGTKTYEDDRNHYTWYDLSGIHCNITTTIPLPKTQPATEPPAFLKKAIVFETTLIHLRHNQIRQYIQRIELMKAGMDYKTSINKIPPIHGISFDWPTYFKLKSMRLK